MEPSVLIMFSGGLDSTGMLWKLISQKSNIHIHHMNLMNQEKRARVESVAVKNILNYVSKHGTFAYSESTHIYPSFNNKFMWDSDIVSFISGTICLSMPSIKHIAIGMTKTDMENRELSDRVQRSSKILSAFTNATKIYPVKDMSKFEIYEFLPTELRNLTWSCRTPIYKDGKAISCDQCPTCKTMKEIDDKLRIS